MPSGVGRTVSWSPTRRPRRSPAAFPSSWPRWRRAPTWSRRARSSPTRGSRPPRRRPASTPPPARQVSSVVGTGVNPGFAMDYLPVVLSGAAKRVDSVRSTASRTPGCAGSRSRPRWAPASRREEFDRRVASGSIGHVGLTESAQAVAAALGWDATGTSETIEPVRGGRPIPSAFGTIEPGRITGIDQVAVVVADGVERVRLHLHMAVGIGPSRDDIWLTGDPTSTCRVPGGLHGDLATAAALVNTIGSIRHAEPGLRVMSELRPPRPAPSWQVRRAHLSARRRRHARATTCPATPASSASEERSSRPWPLRARRSGSSRRWGSHRSTTPSSSRSTGWCSPAAPTRTRRCGASRSIPPRCIDETRDRWSTTLLAGCIERRIPVLGVCRGLQVINVALGGTPGPGPSSRTGRPPRRRRTGPSWRTSCACSRAARLAAIAGARSLRVNTAHHQAIGRLGRTGSSPPAWAEDGCVEASSGRRRPTGWSPSSTTRRTCTRPILPISDSSPPSSSRHAPYASDGRRLEERTACTT